MKALFNHLNSKKKPTKQNFNSQLNLKYLFTKSSAVNGKPSPQKSKNRNLSRPNRPNSNQLSQDKSQQQQQALSQKSNIALGAKAKNLKDNFHRKTKVAETDCFIQRQDSNIVFEEAQHSRC
jgi:hypothetical protein